MSTSSNTNWSNTKTFQKGSFGGHNPNREDYRVKIFNLFYDTAKHCRQFMQQKLIRKMKKSNETIYNLGDSHDDVAAKMAHTQSVIKQEKQMRAIKHIKSEHMKALALNFLVNTKEFALEKFADFFNKETKEAGGYLAALESIKTALADKESPETIFKQKLLSHPRYATFLEESAKVMGIVGHKLEKSKSKRAMKKEKLRFKLQNKAASTAVASGVKPEEVAVNDEDVASDSDNEKNDKEHVEEKKKHKKHKKEVVEEEEEEELEEKEETELQQDQPKKDKKKREKSSSGDAPAAPATTVLTQKQKQQQEKLSKEESKKRHMDFQAAAMQRKYDKISKEFNRDKQPKERSEFKKSGRDRRMQLKEEREQKFKEQSQANKLREPVLKPKDFKAHNLKNMDQLHPSWTARLQQQQQQSNTLSAFAGTVKML